MNEQTIVTDYFTAAKCRQAFQPAKRRKIVADGGTLLQSGSKESFDASSLSVKGTPTTASSRTKQTRTRSRARNSKNSTTRRNIVAKKTSEGASSEVTSMVDDHDLDRPRKQSQKANLTTIASPSQKAQNGELRSEKEAKEGSDGQEPCPEDKMPVDSSAKPNVVAQQRSSLKIHPWISEQAKVVLASRGKRALEKSLARNPSRNGITSKKSISKPEPEEKKEVFIPKRSVDSLKPKSKVPRLHQSISASSQDLPTNKERYIYNTCMLSSIYKAWCQAYLDTGAKAPKYGVCLGHVHSEKFHNLKI